MKRRNAFARAFGRWRGDLYRAEAAATASGISRRLAEFGLDPSGCRVGQRVLALAGGVQVDQRGTAGGVVHAFHQFADGRPGLGNQPVAGVT